MSGNFITTDLATFLNSDELGDVATYNGNSINVQFFNEYEAAALFELEVEVTKPFCIAKDTDITGIAHGSTITIKSVAYKVIEIQPDGTGLTQLILSKD